MNINKKNIKIIYTTISLFIFLPLMAGAAGLVPCGGPGENACTACDLLVLVQNLLEFALKMAFLIIIGFIVYGGFRWIFSLGKEENLKAGQQIITNAIIGLIIILTAWLIVNTVFWTIKQMGGDDYTGTWFHIECSESDYIFNTPEGSTTPTDNTTTDTDNEDIDDGGDDEWEDIEQHSTSDSNQMCLPTAISYKCPDGKKLNKSKCEPGEHATTTEDYITSDGKGQYCKFVGNSNPAGSEINPCYPPSGTLYIDCIIDPDYISPEEQIKAKKKEIEEKYPDLEGEWIQTPIEDYGATDCGVIDKGIKDGFCFATESTTLILESEIMGNGWFCDFKDDINSPNGKSFAYCVSENNGTPVPPIIPEPEPEPDPEPESKCEDCRGSLLSGDWCYEAECLALGNCIFTNIFGPGGKCEINNE